MKKKSWKVKINAWEYVNGMSKRISKTLNVFGKKRSDARRATRELCRSLSLYSVEIESISL